MRTLSIFFLSISIRHQPWTSTHLPKRISHMSETVWRDAPTAREPLDSRGEWEEGARHCATLSAQNKNLRRWRRGNGRRAGGACILLSHMGIRPVREIRGAQGLRIQRGRKHSRMFGRTPVPARRKVCVLVEVHCGGIRAGGRWAMHLP